MLYFKLDKDTNVTEIAFTAPTTLNADNDWQDRHHWSSFKQVEQIAKSATEKFGVTYVAVDNGAYVRPQFDVIQGFKVGDKVSYGFNGDFYPDGVVTDISSTMKVITTSSNGKYYRQRNTATWKKSKTWSLVSGHHTDKNPHF